MKSKNEPMPPEVMFEREREQIAQRQASGDRLYQPLQGEPAALTKEILNAAGVLEPVAFQINHDTFDLHDRLLKARLKGDSAAEAEALALAATRLHFRWLQVPAAAVRSLLADDHRARTVKIYLYDLGLRRLWHNTLEKLATPTCQGVGSAS